MRYKKWLIRLVIVALAGTVGARFVRNFIFENVGLINRIIYPIGSHQEVVWEKGPVEAQTAPENRPPHNMLVWDATIYQSLLAGDWKLQIMEKTRQQWLFNLAQDPSEKVNLAKTHPEKLNELKSVLADFNRNERAKPLWPMLLETTKEIDPWDGSDELYLWAN